MSMLLDPLVQANDVTQKEHRAILVALLTQGQPGLALKYSKVRQASQKDAFDQRLDIAILIANGMVHEAFQYQRSALAGVNDSNNLLNYLFSKCEHLGKLDSILQLTLLPREEEVLVAFLQSSSKTSSQEVLLEYFLQRSKYTEVVALNEQLNRKRLEETGTKSRRSVIER